MKKSFTVCATSIKALTGIFLMLATFAGSQGLADTNAASGPIPYATLQYISGNDSSDAIAEKAAKVLPRPNQTDLDAAGADVFPPLRREHVQRRRVGQRT